MVGASRSEDDGVGWPRGSDGDEFDFHLTHNKIQIVSPI
jgi:hypothetical protein